MAQNGFKVIDKVVYQGRKYPDVFLGRHTLAETVQDDEGNKNFVLSDMPERIDMAVTAVLPLVYVEEYKDQDGNTYHIPAVLGEPLNVALKVVDKFSEQSTEGIYKRDEYLYESVNSVSGDLLKTNTYLLTALVVGQDKDGNAYVATFPERIRLPGTMIIKELNASVDDKYVLYSNLFRRVLYSKSSEFKTEAEKAINDIVTARNIRDASLIESVVAKLGETTKKHEFLSYLAEQLVPYYANASIGIVDAKDFLKEIKTEDKGTLVKIADSVMDYGNGLIPISDLGRKEDGSYSVLTFVKAPIPVEQKSRTASLVSRKELIADIMQPAALNGKVLYSFQHSVNLLATMAGKVKYYSKIVADQGELKPEQIESLDQFKKKLQSSKMFSSKSQEFIKILNSVPKLTKEKAQSYVALADAILEKTGKAKEIAKAELPEPPSEVKSNVVDYVVSIQSKCVTPEASRIFAYKPVGQDVVEEQHQEPPTTEEEVAVASALDTEFEIPF